MSIYKRNRAIVNVQRETLAQMFELTQIAPATHSDKTMDKGLDNMARRLESLLSEIESTLEDSRYLWDDNYDR